jgi:hypothetical protein
MTQDDYNEYAEGYESGEEAADETRLSNTAQKYTDAWTGRNDCKSEVWWKGFHDGKVGTWTRPKKKTCRQEKGELPDEIAEGAQDCSRRAARGIGRAVQICHNSRRRR